MENLNTLYQELIINHSSNPRNYGVPGWAWRNLDKECHCLSVKCDKKFLVYYTEKELSDGSISLEPWFGTEFHVKNWTWADSIYGPYPLITL